MFYDRLLATGVHSLSYLTSNIYHFFHLQIYQDELFLNQGGWCVGGFNFFSVGLLNPFKFHECFHAGGKKDKLFCNFWSVGGICENCKCAWTCAEACSNFSVCFLYLTVRFLINAVLYLYFAVVCLKVAVRLTKLSV